MERIKQEIVLGFRRYSDKKASLTREVSSFSSESLTLKNTYNGGFFASLSGMTQRTHVNIGEYEKEEGVYGRKVSREILSFVRFVDAAGTRRYDDTYDHARELSRHNVFNERGYANSHKGFSSYTLEDISKSVYRANKFSDVPDDLREGLIEELNQRGAFRLNAFYSGKTKKEFVTRYEKSFAVQEYLLKNVNIMASDIGAVIAGVEKLDGATPRLYFNVNSASKAIGRNFKQTYDLISSVAKPIESGVMSGSKSFSLATEIVGTTFTDFRGETEESTAEINNYINTMQNDKLFSMALLDYDKEGNAQLNSNMVKIAKSGIFKTVDVDAISATSMNKAGIASLEKLPADLRKKAYDNSGATLLKLLSPKDAVAIAQNVARVKVYEEALVSGLLSKDLRNLNTSDKIGRHSLAEFLAPSGIYHKPERASHITNLYHLSSSLVDPIEKHFGKKVVITSGIREEDYNKKIGGAERSAHLTGNAIDFYVPGEEKSAVADFIRKNLSYDQLIDEGGIFHISTYAGERNRGHYSVYQGADRIKRFKSGVNDSYKNSLNHGIVFIDEKESSAYVDMLMDSYAQMMGYNPRILFSEAIPLAENKSVLESKFFPKTAPSVMKQFKFFTENNFLAGAAYRSAGYASVVAGGKYLAKRFAGRFLGKVGSFLSGGLTAGLMFAEGAVLTKEYILDLYSRTKESRGAISYLTEEHRGDRILNSTPVKGANIFNVIGLSGNLDYESKLKADSVVEYGSSYEKTIINMTESVVEYRSSYETARYKMAEKISSYFSETFDKTALTFALSWATEHKDKVRTDYAVLIDELTSSFSKPKIAKNSYLVDSFYEGLSVITGLNVKKELPAYLMTEGGREEGIRYMRAIIQATENHGNVKDKWGSARMIISDMMARGYLSKEELIAMRSDFVILRDFQTMMSPPEFLYSMVSDRLDKLVGGKFNLGDKDPGSYFSDPVFFTWFYEWKIDSDKTNDESAKTNIESFLKRQLLSDKLFEEGMKIFDVELSDDMRIFLQASLHPYVEKINSREYVRVMTDRSLETAMNVIDRRLENLDKKTKSGQLKKMLREKKRQKG